MRVTTPTVLVATWEDGLFVVTEATRPHELAGQSINALASDGRGGALAIVGKGSLRRRDPAGSCKTITLADELACCVAVGDDIYVGTDEAQLLLVDANGRVQPLRTFDLVCGRENWYAGQAVIDGRVVGPPLGIRSITATSDGVLLANVHVGGIPRSTDGGATWTPTIDIESDVHEVRAHPSRADVVVAAAAVGLCISRDGGATWQIEDAGLHAPHCSAVAFVGDDIFISAATDPFAKQGAVYRRPLDGPGPLALVGGGLPAWMEGRVDTRCIAARDEAAAICDGGGNLYVSTDTGQTWSLRASGLPFPSSVLIV